MDSLADPTPSGLTPRHRQRMPDAAFSIIVIKALTGRHFFVIEMDTIIREPHAKSWLKRICYARTGDC